MNKLKYKRGKQKKTLNDDYGEKSADNRFKIIKIALKVFFLIISMMIYC